MKEIDYAEIGQRLRIAREALGLTQEAASEKSGITSAFYGNIERGDRKMSVDTLYRISRALGVSSDYLLFGEPMQKEMMETLLTEIQRKSDEKQFEKFIMILKTLSTIIDKL